MIKVKTCVICYKKFSKHPKNGYMQWNRQKFCSNACRKKGFSSFNCGKNNPNWKGGKYFDADGYIYIRAPRNHPFKTFNGYIFEHRFIMENYIGHYLNPSDKIHHINGIKDDNRIENLIVISQSEHIAIHRNELVNKRWHK